MHLLFFCVTLTLHLLFWVELFLLPFSQAIVFPIVSACLLFFFFFEAPDFRLFFRFVLISSDIFLLLLYLYEGDAAAFFSLCILFNPVFIVTLLQPVLDLGERCIRQETRCSKKQGINEEQGRAEQDKQTRRERAKITKSREQEVKKPLQFSNLKLFKRI